MSKLQEISENDFQSTVLSVPTPTLVEFGAVWCRPCKSLEPILLQIAAELEGRLNLVKLDVDESNALAMQYQVMSVPTTILFINGEPLERWVGLQPKDKFLSKLSPHIPKV